MMLCEFMQQQVPDLPRVPLDVQCLGRISVVGYDTYLFYFITSINTTSWAASNLERRNQNQRNLRVRPSLFCIFAFFIGSEINWQNNACDRREIYRILLLSEISLPAGRCEELFA